MIVAYNLVFKIEVFSNKYKEWHKLEPANKIQAQLKGMLTAVHEDLQE